MTSMTAPGADERKTSMASTNAAASPTAQQFPRPLQANPPNAMPMSPTGAMPMSSRDAMPMSPTSPTSPTSRTAPQDHDQRDSDEWDASKVPPSRFQKRKGSIYAVPSTRDGRVDANGSYAEQFHKKLAEMGYDKKEKAKGYGFI